MIEGGRIISPEPRQGHAVVEQTGVEEIGTDATRLECELAKSQGLVFERQRQEILLVIVHAPQAIM